jgi:hypothetical protein
MVTGPGDYAISLMPFPPEEPVVIGDEARMWTTLRICDETLATPARLERAT